MHRGSASFRALQGGRRLRRHLSICTRRRGAGGCRCFFICAFVPIYWVSRLVVHLLVLVVEAKLFTNAKVLFFLLSVRVSPLPAPRAAGPPHAFGAAPTARMPDELVLQPASMHLRCGRPQVRCGSQDTGAALWAAAWGV